MTSLRTVPSTSTAGNQVAFLSRVRVVMPPQGKKSPSGGRMVTRLRTVPSGDTAGNQVVQRPPDRLALQTRRRGASGRGAA